jgi:hypothetical protein
VNNKQEGQTMVKMLELTNKTPLDKMRLNKCNVCDTGFSSEEEFKDHILTTIHKGPSDGTRNFKYRLTAKTAKSNLLKGARRKLELELNINREPLILTLVMGHG